ncbi:MAG: metallophosphoesterase family protein [Mucilaginibacter sp.]
MKVAIISDLHGNIDALDAVVSNFEKYDISKVFVLGDIVGYYYYPEKILSLLEKYDCLYIRGNHERILQNLIAGKVSSEEVVKKYGHGHDIAIEKLSNSQIEFLINLPDELAFNLDGKNFLLKHANPWNLDDYLYSDSNETDLKRALSGNYDYVFVGHSHYSFDFLFDSKTLINPGSVGQNRKKGGCASWVLFDTSEFNYRFIDTNYSINNLLLMIDKVDPQNDYLKRVLLR